MASRTWMLVAVIALAHCSEAYKILVVFPLSGRSHGILGEGIVKSLLEAGHEVMVGPQVTYVTPFPVKNSSPNFRQVDISDKDTFESVKKQVNVTAILEGESSISPMSVISGVQNMTKNVLTNPNFQKLLGDSSQTFDLVIGEWMFTEIYVGLGYLFNCPFIWSSSTEPHWTILSLIDESVNPSYIGDVMTNSIPPFGFKARVKELLFQVAGMALRYFFLEPFQNEIFHEVFGPHIIKRGRPLVSFEDVRYNASLVLSNSHVSLGQATRLPQAFIPIAGYHIATVVKPLPDNLKKLLDNAKHGLIYFSLGSTLSSKDLPDRIKKDLLEMFGSLKQTVLWKFEEVLPNLPSNVHIVDWAPQHSILDHPNCVLFITHGGILSTTETVHFGKPVLGIPVFADQFNNIDWAVRKGFARRVDLSYDMKDKFSDALDDLLNNKIYAERVKELSLAYHDRLVHPSKELVHWVEHVVMTRGALHLRSPALDVPFYQKMYLDLLALVSIILYVIKKTVTLICCSKIIVDKKKKMN